jgi:nucleoside-diphosphate kinase
MCSKLRMCHLSKAEASEFYAVHQRQPFFEALTDFMSSGKILAMELVSSDGIAKWQALIGPTSPATARSEAPQSLRAQFGSDDMKNAFHGSDAPDTAEKARSNVLPDVLPLMLRLLTSACGTFKTWAGLSKAAV